MKTVSNVLIAHDSYRLKEYLSKINDYSEHVLNKISLQDQDAWTFRDEVLSHSSNGFFHVVGVKNQQEPDDEHLMLYQPQSALTGLIIHKKDDQVFVLLQARVEPGNTGIIQYGPTIQSTPANYLRLHGGKSTSYTGNFTTFTPGQSLHSHSMQHDLGKRYYQKSKTHHYIIADELIETDENMIWASLDAILALSAESNFLNADLRSLLAVFDWDTFMGNRNEVQSAHPGILKFQQLAQIHSRKTTRNYRLTGLDELNNWEITEEGVHPKNRYGPGVQMFHFSCSNREVKAWSQPLYTVTSQGLVQLGIRRTENDWEALVRIGHEPGISTRYAVYPTILFYGSEMPGKNPIHGRLLHEMLQCDEGGRFYRNDSRYQIIELDEGYSSGANECWVPFSLLKQLLESSNVCSFQLRCASSMLLDKLNPGIAKADEKKILKRMLLKMKIL